METTDQLMEKLSEPSADLIEMMKTLDGDIMILGVGGKMGPSLAIKAVRAIREAEVEKKVIGVSRFSDPNSIDELESFGVETIKADLMNESSLNSLPKIKNIIYMAGKKFGTNNNESFTWAMNSYLPGRICNHFSSSRIVAFSSGNIYPFMSPQSGGANEDTPPEPIGEYAQSCLGRERIFEYFSIINQIPMVFFRLNYAVETRYGVCLEIAQNVLNERPIDLTTGFVNVIWQGDANDQALRSLEYCSTPVKRLNITGPEVVSIRWLATQFGNRFNKEPVFINEEANSTLLNNASLSHKLFGYPSVSLKQIIDWTADWVLGEGIVLNKPTHFQERKGSF
ncbi:NAD-dependent epimerase/dehydratase family protein [Alteribacter aurantiacus]|uniref:NAD-dependent epimerase/dehydratase family protein n=1 Tax=Alteribacter aurantiacus TaxID=254410 RepID=UPI000411E594|nr:NAD(P)-dependent oxidoreductase [Alteribacter aurantiacus]